MKITIDGQPYEVERGASDVTIGTEVFRVSVEESAGAHTVLVNDIAYRVELPAEQPENDIEATVLVDGHPHTVVLQGRMRAPRPEPKAAVAPAPARGPVPEGAIVAAMAGRIVSVHVEVGQRVTTGDLLVIVEAMKMENEMKATIDGTVTALEVAPGTRVNEGDVLVVVQ